MLCLANVHLENRLQLKSSCFPVLLGDSLGLLEFLRSKQLSAVAENNAERAVRVTLNASFADQTPTH